MLRIVCAGTVYDGKGGTFVLCYVNGSAEVKPHGWLLFNSVVPLYGFRGVYVCSHHLGYQ